MLTIFLAAILATLAPEASPGSASTSKAGAEQPATAAGQPASTAAQTATEASPAATAPTTAMLTAVPLALPGATAGIDLPGAKSATMAILGVSAAGKISLLGNVKTATGSHCVVSDDQRQAWICDPQGGRLLLVAHTLQAGAP